MQNLLADFAQFSSAIANFYIYRGDWALGHVYNFKVSLKSPYFLWPCLKSPGNS